MPEDGPVRRSPRLTSVFVQDALPASALAVEILGQDLGQLTTAESGQAGARWTGLRRGLLHPSLTLAADSAAATRVAPHPCFRTASGIERQAVAGRRQAAPTRAGAERQTGSGPGLRPAGRAELKAGGRLGYRCHSVPDTGRQGEDLRGQRSPVRPQLRCADSRGRQREQSISLRRGSRNLGSILQLSVRARRVVLASPAPDPRTSRSRFGYRRDVHKISRLNARGTARSGPCREPFQKSDSYVRIVPLQTPKCCEILC